MGVILDKLEKYIALETKKNVSETVDLNSILQEVVQVLKEKYVNRKFEIAYKELPRIEANDKLVYDLFYYLLDNAVYFSKPDTSNYIEVRHKLDEMFHFEIEDQGIGIPKNQIAGLFDLFKTNNKDEYANRTGFGLAMSEKIVKHYKGDIGIESKGEEGLIVRFSLVSK